jgi:hypothetical protein
MPGSFGRFQDISQTGCMKSESVSIETGGDGETDFMECGDNGQLIDKPVLCSLQHV